jgi:hypothetical protein
MRPVDEIDNVTPLLRMKKRHDGTKDATNSRSGTVVELHYVAVFFIGTVYRLMLVFSTYYDFHPPVSGVLPPYPKTGKNVVKWRKYVPFQEEG